MTDHYQDLVKQTLRELEHLLNSIEEHAMHKLLQALLDTERIFIAGKGRSGLQMQALAMRFMHLGLQTFVSDDVTTPAISAGDLLLIGSGSGQTPSLVGYAQQAKKVGAKLALITATQPSPLALQADLVLLLSAPTPKAQIKGGTFRSIQPMGTLFEQALGLFGDLIVLILMDMLDINADEMFTHHANLE